jgi:hypothetical protein
MLNWLFFDPRYMGNYGFGGYGGYGGFGYAGAPIQDPTEQDKYIDARLHALEMACAGLWELLKQKNGYSDQELADIIKGLDQKRATTGTTQATCPRCGHPMLTHNHSKCLWCGADLQGAPFVPPATP